MMKKKFNKKIYIASASALTLPVVAIPAIVLNLNNDQNTQVENKITTNFLIETQVDSLTAFAQSAIKGQLARMNEIMKADSLNDNSNTTWFSDVSTHQNLRERNLIKIFTEITSPSSTYYSTLSDALMLGIKNYLISVQFTSEQYTLIGANQVKLETILNTVPNEKLQQYINQFFSNWEAFFNTKLTANGRGYEWFSDVLSNVSSINEAFKYDDPSFESTPNSESYNDVVNLISNYSGQFVLQKLNFSQIISNVQTELKTNYEADLKTLQSKEFQSNIKINLDSNSLKLTGDGKYLNFNFFEKNDFKSTLENANNFSRNGYLPYLISDSIGSIFTIRNNSGLDATFRVKTALGNATNNYTQVFETEMSVDTSVEYILDQINKGFSNETLENTIFTVAENKYSADKITEADLIETDILKKYRSVFNIEYSDFTFNTSAQVLTRTSNATSLNNATVSIKTINNSHTVAYKNNFYLNKLIPDKAAEILDAPEIASSLTALGTITPGGVIIKNQTNWNEYITYNEADTQKYKYTTQSVNYLNENNTLNENKLNVETTVSLVSNPEIQKSYTSIISNVKSSTKTTESDLRYFRTDQSEANTSLTESYGTAFSNYLKNNAAAVETLYINSVGETLEQYSYDSVNDIPTITANPIRYKAVHDTFKNKYTSKVATAYGAATSQSEIIDSSDTAMLAAGAALAATLASQGLDLDKDALQKINESLTDAQKKSLAALTNGMSENEAAQFLNDSSSVVAAFLKNSLNADQTINLLQQIANINTSSVRLATDSIAGSVKYVGLGLVSFFTLMTLIVAIRGSLIKGKENKGRKAAIVGFTSVITVIGIIIVIVLLLAILSVI